MAGLLDLFRQQEGGGGVTGLLTQDDSIAARNRGLLGMAGNLLAASGPSTQPVSFGQAVGSGIQGFTQAHDAERDSRLKSRLYEQRADQALNPVAPSSVREWEYFNSLDEKDQKDYLKMKRSSHYYDMNGVEMQADPIESTATPVAPAGQEGATQDELRDQLTQQEADRKERVEKSGALGRAEGEKEANKNKARSKLASQIRGADNVLSAVDRALDQTGGWTTGPAGFLLQALPGTPAYDLRNTVLTVKANLGFDRLQEMRDNSPTGGALGQVAVQELSALQAAVDSLDLGQSPTQIEQNLKNVQRHYQNYKNAVQSSYQADYGQSEQAPASDAGSPTVTDDGWTIQEVTP